MKFNNFYRIEYFWFVIINCLSFCSHHVSLVILGPDCPHCESYDFKLFILVYQGYL